MKHVLRALVIALLCGAFFCAPAMAQKTKAQLTTEVSTTFPDNTSGAITPSGVRTFQNDLINSIMPTAPVVSGNLACFNGTTGLLQDCGLAPNSLSVDITNIASGVSGNVLYDNSGKLGEYSVSGTGSVAMTNSPTFTTPNIGAATASSITSSGQYTANNAAGAGLGSAFIANGTAPSFAWNYSGGGADQKLWDQAINGSGNMVFRPLTDAGAAGAPWMTVTRGAGASVSDVSIPNLSYVANSVTNAALAQAGANTLKGNPTGSTANEQDFSIGGLTQKVAPGANDLLLLQDQTASGQLKYATVSSVSAAGSVASLNSETGAIVLWGPPQGRLTLASNTPVMSASQTAQTTIYYTSTAAGKNVPVYNGTAVVVRQLCAANTAGACELSVALGANWLTNSNYDWFVGLDGGTLRLCSGPDWSAGAVAGSNAVGASARGTGAGSTELENFDGLLTNKNSMACRYNNATTFTCAVHKCTYLGTARTGSAGQISFTYGGSGIAANLYVWNAYQQTNICTNAYDSTSSWTYLSTTIRQANASTVNQINFITGGSIPLDASNSVLIRPAASIGAYGIVGIALNSTSVMDKRAQIINGAAQTINLPAVAMNTYNGVFGANYIAATEAGDGATTSTFFSNGYMTLRACLAM